MSQSVAQSSDTEKLSLANLPHLGGKLWRREAPKGLRRENPSGPGFALWAKHLRARPEQPALAKLAAGDSWPLLWASAGVMAEDSVDFATRLAPTKGKKRLASPQAAELVSHWIAEAGDSVASPSLGLEALATAHRLTDLASEMPAGLWWQVLDLLVGLVADAAALPSDSDQLAAQLLGGELALTLAVAFPEIAPCRALAKPARKLLSDSILELTDGEGMLHARFVPQSRAFIACWTRSILLSNRWCKHSCFTDDALDQFGFAATNALRLSRGDGSQGFGTAGFSRADADLFENVITLGGDSSDRAAAALALPSAKSRTGKNGRAEKKAKIPAAGLYEPAVNSEWASVSVLRANWSARSPRAFVRYDSRATQIEIEADGNSLFQGAWDFRIERDGQQLQPIEDWQEVCWTSDDDVDYLELEISLSGNARLQRQIMLAREDQVMYLADVLLGDAPANWTYRGALPMSAGLSLELADDSREGALCAGKHVANVFPVALPEWRDAPATGELTAEGDELVLRQQTSAGRLCCPLFVDLKRSRAKRPFTWRQLTVAEKLEIQPAHVAVGYRVQCAEDQWLFYRSLAPRANRTVLGQNTTVDFLAARFDTTGDIEELVEIE
ncbi:MAG: hypothetical protein KDA42_18865 [Planctomycetales bacterium]|nr:hypothetical protein [Planctomycetales bacterium]